MAVPNTIMVSKSSNNEYGVMVSHKNGLTTIHHLNKEFDKIDPFIHTLISCRPNNFSPTHYMISELEEGQRPKEEISIVEIVPNQQGMDTKFVAKDFTEGYLDFHHSFRFQIGAVHRKVGSLSRPPLITFASFIEFMVSAYPADYQKWKLADPGPNFVRRTLEVPNLPA